MNKQQASDKTIEQHKIRRTKKLSKIKISSNGMRDRHGSHFGFLIPQDYFLKFQQKMEGLYNL